MSQDTTNIFLRLKPFYKHLLPVKWHFIGGLLATALYSLSSGIGLPLMSKTVFPIIFRDEEAIEDVPESFLNFVQDLFGDDLERSMLIFSVIGIPLVMLIRSAGHFISGYLMSYTGLRVSEAIRTSVFSHIQSMPLAFFQKYKSGDLLSRLMGDTEAVKKAIVNLSNDLIRQPLTLLAAVGTIVYLALKEDSFFFALLAACSAPLLVFPIRMIGKKLAKRSKQLAYVGADLTSFTTESIQSPLEIRAYNLGKPMVSRFKGQLETVIKLTIKHIKYSLITTPLIEVVAAASLSFALYIGASKGMDFGSFMALAIALYMAYEPVKKLGRIHGMLRSLEAPLERLEKILDEEDTVPEASHPAALPLEVKGEITLRGVSFAYNNQGSALKNIDCHISAGEIVALVGPSGAGKTTFMNLIPRFYDPTEGEILIDGVNVKSWKKEDLRSLMAYVPQMPILFNATVADNIRVGRENATEEEIRDAAKHAFAHDFIQEMENGYETIVSERGNSLSGGQRQRIAIARAFLKDAPILLLDEATSALDNESETMITKALDKLMTGKTTLMIAHRESSLKSATSEIAFEQGSMTSYKNLPLTSFHY